MSKQSQILEKSGKQKKIWKKPNTDSEWKKENLDSILLRMSDSQLKTFKSSYHAKVLKKKPQN